MISITDCDLKGKVVRRGERFIIEEYKHLNKIKRVFIVKTIQGEEIARSWDIKPALIIFYELEPEKSKKYILPYFFKEIARAIDRSSFPEPGKSDLLRDMRELKYKPHIIFDLLKKNFMLF